MSNSHGELAIVLRSWRDRLSPADAGLPHGGVRRAAGLRREELASLAGLSVDYIVRLEQGRSENPSPQVLTALARALRLSKFERDHLFRVAGELAPSDSLVPRHVPPSTQRLLDRMSDLPVGVFSVDWTLLSWNAAWTSLVGDPSSRRGRELNIAWRHFRTVDPLLERSAQEIAAFEASMVADLRMASGRYPQDAGLAGLISELRRDSPVFETLWGKADVAARHSDRKTFRHPTVGSLTLDCDVLTVPDSDLRIIAYSAIPASVDAEKLELVTVAGLQAFAS
ncbi:helix-turn-helix transcriptional regulator [Glaciihabitans sp. UYNi722]|uniref:helix-turn-helix transcriptional regulator n=1 Tax=Glaciihabitans sp. UYNi722 TaxID=3156344 RepID=UPI0033968A5A